MIYIAILAIVGIVILEFVHISQNEISEPASAGSKDTFLDNLKSYINQISSTLTGTEKTVRYPIATLPVRKVRNNPDLFNQIFKFSDLSGELKRNYQGSNTEKPTEVFHFSGSRGFTVPTMGPMSHLINAIATGIARGEGFFAAGENTPKRNHNPGDLRDSNNRLFPQFKKDSRGYVIFPNDAVGWQYLKRDIQIKLSGRSQSGFKTSFTWQQLADLYASTSPEIERIAWANTVVNSIRQAFNVDVSVNDRIDVTMGRLNV